MIGFSFRKAATCAVIAAGVLASAQPALAAKLTTVNGVIVAQTSPKAVVIAGPSGHLLRVVLFRPTSGVIGRRLKVKGLIDGLGIMTAYSSSLGVRTSSTPVAGTIIANDVGVDYLADAGAVIALHAGTLHAPGLTFAGTTAFAGSTLAERSGKSGPIGGALNISGVVSVMGTDGIAVRLPAGANVWLRFRPKTIVDISTLWAGAAVILKAEVVGTSAQPVLQFSADAVLTGPRALKSARKLESQGKVTALSGQRISVAPEGAKPVDMIIGAGASVAGIGTDDTVLLDAHSTPGGIVADHIVLVARAVPAVPAKVTWTSTPPARTNARVAKIDWSLDAKAEQVLCAIDDDVYKACQAPYVTPTLAPQKAFHRFSVYTWNAKGASIAVFQWYIDDPIDVQMVSSPTATTTATTASFVFKVTGKQTGFLCSLAPDVPGLTSFATCTPTQEPGKTDTWRMTYSGLKVVSLPYSFSVKVVTATSEAVTMPFVFSIVLPAPVVTVTAPASSTATSGNVLYAATNAPTSYSCAVDGAAAAACSGGVWPVSGLSIGVHTVTVKATSSGGTGTGTGSWIVSAPPVPLVTLPGAPTGAVATTSATIYWFASGSPDSETCSIDGAAAAPCPGPVASGALAAGSIATGVLASGPHSVVVTATNSSGTSSATAAWTIEATPVVTITASPTTGTATTGAVSFTATNTPTSVTCQLDSGSPVACTSPFNLTVLALGSHAVTVAASNVAGTGTRTTSSWTVNAPAAGAPVIAVTAAPSGTVAPPTPTITWTTTNGPTTDTCKLDGGAAAACPGGSYAPSAGLAAGAHSLLITATNGTAPLTLSGTATVAWSIAATPVVTITASPATGTATSGTVSFTTSGSPTSIACALDGGSQAACASPYSLTGLALGSHVVTVAATNAAGTGSATTTAWTVQGPSPVVTLVSPPTGSTTVTSATISWTATNSPTSTTCKLDAAAAVPCTQPAGFATGTLSFGSHAVVVTATNATGSGSATASWTVTALAPTVALTTGAAGFPPLTNATPSATFTWTTGGGAATATTCQLDAAAAAACTSPKAYAAVTSGTHSFTVTVANSGGSATATYTWAVAAGALPTVSFTQVPAPSGAATTATIAWTTTNGPTTDTCTLDGGPYTPCTAAAVNLSGLAVGSHSFIVIAANASGSGLQATASWTVIAGVPKPVNNTLPTLSGSSLAQTAWSPRSGVLGTNGYILNGTWTGATSFSYQWMDCGLTKVLANCVPISGATASSYHAVAANIDNFLVGKVIASNAGGSTEAITAFSAKTQPS